MQMKNNRPNHFTKLIQHYDLLVHGISGKYRVLGGGDVEAQMKYQANLLKSIGEACDSDPEDESGSEDEGTEGGSSEDHGKGKSRARDNT